VPQIRLGPCVIGDRRAVMVGRKTPHVGLQLGACPRAEPGATPRDQTRGDFLSVGAREGGRSGGLSAISGTGECRVAEFALRAIPPYPLISARSDCAIHSERFTRTQTGTATDKA
jgi:hypothetical protein